MSIEHRLNHIAGQLSGHGDVLLHSLDAHTGEALPYAFHQATDDEVEAAAQAAEVATRATAAPARTNAPLFSTQSPANWTRWVMTSSRM